MRRRWFSHNLTTLGVACVMVAAAVQFGDLGTVARAVLVIAFLFFTAPVAAHTIGRAAYFHGVPLWDGSLVDELREHDRRDQPAMPVSEAAVVLGERPSGGVQPVRVWYPLGSAGGHQFIYAE